MSDLSGASAKTERLVLRPYSLKDADMVYKVISRREISDMTMRIPYPCPEEYTEHWIEWIIDGRAQGLSCEFGIFNRADGLYIGNCGLIDISKRHMQASVVYFIDPELWGYGYATEALEAVRDFGFSKLGLERLNGQCFEKNIASRRVMEKIGMKLEGVARHDIYKDGSFHNVCTFGILRSEWEERFGV